ncbi:MAG: ABC transporter ATP-binding protein [Beijerinckiaceae bacterium]|nr:ABC transporter ATP-binding protein [Beijerinckiaceae bacterium]
MSDPSIISCDRLGKIYLDNSGREVVAFEDISLKIARGDFVTVIGPSGCGKTSLLFMLAGFESKTSGAMLIEGEPIKGPGADRAVVFQEYALFPWLNLRRNIEYGPREKAMPRDEMRRKVDEMLDVVGLASAAERYPHELSAGMRQRAALARVLVNEPKILLMDEPFAALDAQTRLSLQRELSRLSQELALTVMFITHSVEEAVLLGDRILVMTARPGQIYADVAVNLPKPRDPTAHEFSDRRRDVEDLLKRASAQTGETISIPIIV